MGLQDLAHFFGGTNVTPQDFGRGGPSNPSSGGLGQGLGGIGSALGGGNVNTNWANPQIDTSATDIALQRLQQGSEQAQQQEATQLARGLATGTGPSFATQLLEQQTQTAQAAANAQASSGTGASGQGVARRQAMMTGADLSTKLGGAAATTRAEEQLGGITGYGSMAGAKRGQDIQSALGEAGIQSGLATHQADLYAGAEQLSAQSQAQNQQSGNQMLGTIGTLGMGAAMMFSSPASKTDVAPAGDSTEVAGSPSPSSTSSPPESDKEKGEKMIGKALDELRKPQRPILSLASSPEGKTNVMSMQDMVRQKHASLYKPGIVQPMATEAGRTPESATLSSPPESKEAIKEAHESPAVPGYSYPQEEDFATPYGFEDQLTRRSVLSYKPAEDREMEVPDPYRSLPQGLEVQRREEGGAQLPPAPEHVAPMTYYVTKEHSGEPTLQGRPAYVQPTPEHERPEGITEAPRVIPEGWDDKSVSKLEDTALGKKLGHTGEKHISSEMYGKLRQAYESLSSPPAAKEDKQSDDGDIGGALRNLTPYSYRYKNPGNEPIPNPTGGERFFGIMTTDLKKHPVTRAMVSGEGAGEKIAIPAATSFTLASVAHLQKRLDALEKMLGGAHGRR